MKVLIVDDEAPARDSLILLCERSDDIQVVGEAACGMAAIDAAGKLDPDLMLLNVEVSDMSGFALLRTMRGGTHPLGIMVSPCPDQAIRAFTEGAIDYLVTPVTADRFDLAMARVRHRCSSALPGYGSFISRSSDLGRPPPASHGSRTFALTLNSGVCLHSSAAYRDAILRIIPLPPLSKRYRGTAS